MRHGDVKSGEDSQQASALTWGQANAPAEDASQRAPQASTPAGHDEDVSWSVAAAGGVASILPSSACDVRREGAVDARQDCSAWAE